MKFGYDKNGVPKLFFSLYFSGIIKISNNNKKKPNQTNLLSKPSRELVSTLQKSQL